MIGVAPMVGVYAKMTTLSRRMIGGFIANRGTARRDHWSVRTSGWRRKRGCCCISGSILDGDGATFDNEAIFVFLINILSQFGIDGGQLRLQPFDALD